MEMLLPTYRCHHEHYRYYYHRIRTDHLPVMCSQSRGSNKLPSTECSRVGARLVTMTEASNISLCHVPSRTREAKKG